MNHKFKHYSTILIAEEISIPHKNTNQKTGAPHCDTFKVPNPNWGLLWQPHVGNQFVTVSSAVTVITTKNLLLSSASDYIYYLKHRPFINFHSRLKMYARYLSFPKFLKQKTKVSTGKTEARKSFSLFFGLKFSFLRAH